jgi:hypothetical protein
MLLLFFIVTLVSSLENKPNFIAAKLKLENLLDLIYNRYQLSEKFGDFFYVAQTLSAHSWDIYKHRFAKKIVKGSDNDNRYLMIFGGSSVTAGHDNKPNSSYPGIVQKRLSGVFQDLAIDFQVHNIAQGANNCHPYELCYESMGGVDPDFVGWEQVYICHLYDDFIIQVSII